MLTFINTKIIWSPALVGLCLGCGLFFSLRSRFLQLRLLKPMLATVFKRDSSQKGISAFQAMSVAVSGSVGTGNISGTATAIYAGGPGALFWMWVIAFLGAATAFVESTLAQIWKVELDGQYRGGPAYYIQRGMGKRGYGVLFSLAAVPCCGLILCGVQANNIGISIQNVWDIPPWAIGLGLSICVALIIFGGMGRIARISEIIAPLMAVSYIVLALVVIIVNIQALPGLLKTIVGSAFGRDPVFGGLCGSAVAWGVKRGLFSNEAGQGTAAHSGAASEVSHPAKQGLIQGMVVYIDTILVCSATGFMLLLTNCYNVADPNGGYLVLNLAQSQAGPAYAQAAVSSIFPGQGGWIIAVFLGFFAFTSIPVSYYNAETNLAFLCPKNRGLRHFLTFILRVCCVSFIFVSTLSSADSAWGLGDIGIGVMAWINLIAILILHKQALGALWDYESQLKQGKDPVWRGWA